MRRPAIGIIGAVFVACAAAVSACTGAAPTENKAAADELTAMWAKAFNAGDAAALAALYADDARSTPPGGPPAVGRTQIETYWRNDLKAGGEVTKLTSSGAPVSLVRERRTDLLQRGVDGATDAD